MKLQPENAKSTILPATAGYALLLPYTDQDEPYYTTDNIVAWHVDTYRTEGGLLRSNPAKPIVPDIDHWTPEECQYEYRGVKMPDGTVSIPTGHRFNSEDEWWDFLVWAFKRLENLDVA